MFFLVQDGAIAGDAIAEIEIPGFDCIEVESGWSKEDCYVDEGEIKRKPERPSPEHFWKDNGWNLPEKVEVPVLPDAPITESWGGLESALRGSTIYAKIYFAISEPEAATVAGLTKMMKANAAYTLLLNTITTTHAQPDFEFAIAQLREAMKTMKMGDFAAEEIEWLNSTLKANNFTLQLS